MHVLRTDDCIVAISTPAGRSPRGIVRITGPSAVPLCAKCFCPNDSRPLASQPAWRLVPGWLGLEQGTSVPCNAVIFLPPRSYTGQPLVELHLAGAPALLEMALRALLAVGARLAEPGEFTARAFLTGRMDLLSAEAVAERISARSDAQLSAAQQLAEGTLAERVRAATDELTDLLSLVEAGIDFADEPVEFIDTAGLMQRLANLQASLQDLLARSIDMQRLQALPRIALVGPMSAGKSSLVNRLTGLDRSICSPIPGTTRDVLSAVMGTPAGQVLLLDGPGLGSPHSDIDRSAQAAWRDLLAHVDLALVVLPADQLYDTWLRQGSGEPSGSAADEMQASVAAVAARPYLLVLNKQDLLDANRQTELSGATPALFAGVLARARKDAGEKGSGTFSGRHARDACGRTLLDKERTITHGNLPPAEEPPAVHMISAVTGAGCDDLRAAIGVAVAGLSTSGEGRIVLTARHSQALRAGIEAICAAALIGDVRRSAELIALHLRDAADQLGRITGLVTTEDLLERVFSRFCIGK